jgi:hypothetical protein
MEMIAEELQKNKDGIIDIIAQTSQKLVAYYLSENANLTQILHPLGPAQLGERE